MKPALLGFLFCAALAGQPASIEGTVVNQTTGQPISGVHIRLATGIFGDGAGNDLLVYGAISDRAGHFSVTGMKPGLFLVVIERAGFVEVPATKSNMPVTMLPLKPGQQLTDYKVVMTPIATISGRVVDEYGDPVPHLTVELEAPAGSPMYGPFDGPRNNATDDRGEFHMAAAPGRYYLKVAIYMPEHGNPEIRTDGTSGAPFVTSYYPSSTSTSGASAVQAAPGQDITGLEIRLMRGSSAPGSAASLSISGVVNGLPENPMMVQVALFHGDDPEEMNETRTTNVMSGNKFQFGRLQPGPYRVVARYSSGRTHLQSQPVDLTLGNSDETNLQLTLAPGEELAGALAMAGDTAPEVATPKRMVRLEPIDNMSQFGGGDSTGEGDVDASGAFRISNILPGKFHAVVEPLPENGYIESVMIDNTVVPDNQVDFSHGVKGAHLKITVNRNGGQVLGTVLDKDGQPLVSPMVMIYLVSDPKQLKEMQEDDIHKAVDGKYGIKAIRPGKYRIFALDALSLFAAADLDGDNDELMKSFFNSAEEIEIKPGARIVKDLKAVDKKYLENNLMRETHHILRGNPGTPSERRPQPELAAPRQVRASLFALTLCLALSAQTAPPAAPASVSGTVTNSVTGDPILRAHVRLQTLGGNNPGDNPQTYGALTNQEGKFTIAPIPEGPYVVSADRVGFVAPNTPASSVTLAAGDKKEDLKLTLTPAGAIMGRVLDSAGEPVAHAMVQADGNNNNQNTTTDEQGRYRIGGLPPGKYRVQASPPVSPFPNEIRTDGTEVVHYSATYYPGSLARTSVQRLEVQPAAELNGIDVRLVRTAVLAVSGKVFGLPGGAARTNLQVMRDGQFGGGSAPGIVKSDGSFVISPIDPGKYTIVAMTYAGQRSVQSAPVEIEVAGANIDHMELRMIPPFEVSGQLRFDDDAARMPPQPPTRSGMPAAGQSPRPRQIILQAVGGYSNNPPAGIAADDTFTLENVQPGRYHVAPSWGPAYVRSVRAGDTETEGNLLDVRSGPVGPVTITVSSLTCKVSGTVNDSNGPVSHGRVFLVPDGDLLHFVRSASVKADGTYVLDGVPPGKYKIAATDEGFFPNSRSDNALEDYDDVVALELRAGDKITQNLKRQ